MRLHKPCWFKTSDDTYYLSEPNEDGIRRLTREGDESFCLPVQSFFAMKGQSAAFLISSKRTHGIGGTFVTNRVEEKS